MIKFLIAFFCLMNAINSYAYWNCAWPHRTELEVSEESGTTLTNYQIQVTIDGGDLNNNYDWTTNGFDLRILDSDDQTLLDYWVEDWDQAGEETVVWIRLNTLLANETRTLYIYHGNEFADQLANVPFTFVDPGIKFHTRNVTKNPKNLSEAEKSFDKANDGIAGYGCTFITDFTDVENSREFGSNNNFIAYSETYFKVENDEAGQWGIRYGADFGGGGGLYVDNIALEEQWGDDIWWDYDWNVPSGILEGSINLTAGYHKLEIIGQEGGNDGGITVQFQRPGDAFIAYDTSDIEIVSRVCPASSEPTYKFGAQATASCPTPIAQYRLDEGGWGGVADVIDQTGNYPGSMIGNVNAVANTQVCNGAQVGSNTIKNDIDIIQTGVDLDDDIGAVGAISFWIRFDQDWNSTGGLTVLDSTLAVTGGASDKYFVLTKENTGRLRWRFEDSSDADFSYLEPALSNTRTANTWYHITLNFDFPGDEFSLYVDEDRVINETPNTNGTVSDFGFISLGDNNAPLSSAGGNSSNAAFDEINIFNSTLSISEIRGLMAKTRDCPTNVAKVCGEIFSDGLVALDDGTINFGFDAQLLNNPDNQLSASNITMNGAPNQFTCGGSNVCTTGDPIIPSVSAGPFQFTLSTTNVDVAYNDTQTVGVSTNQYGRINTNFLSVLNFSESTYNEFFIDTLNIGGQNMVNLAPGSYWINNLTIGSDTEFNVLSNGPVRLYINNVTSLASHIIMNSPGDGVAGLPENLLVYFYDTAVSIGNTTTISGTIYAAGDVTFSSDGYIFGLLAAQNINLASNSEVDYVESAFDGLSDITWCASTEPTIGSISIVTASTGINCLASELDILIFDTDGAPFTGYDQSLNFSTDVNHGDWSADVTAFGSVNNGTSDDGNATYAMSTSDTGQVKLLLSNTYAELTNITVESGGVSQTESIDFQAAGFVFSTIPSQVAAVDSGVITLQAVETDLVTGTCQSLLLNPADVDLAVECISPSNCQSAVSTVNSSGVVHNILSGTPLNYSTVGLDFGDATSHTAPIIFNYNDAGSLRLYARYNLKDAGDIDTGNQITGTSNDFVTKPAGFCIESSDPNWQCTTPGLTSSCSAFKEAGDLFNLTVTAKRANGASTDYCNHITTSNFSNAVALTHNLISPTAINGGQAGVFSLSSFTLSSGIGTSPASFDEMGVFSITAGGNDYLLQTLPTNTSVNIGRFYPSNFNVVSTASADFSNGSSGFTYTGQLESDGLTGSISYLTEPEFIFDIRGANNQKLHNYISPLYSVPVATVSASTAATDITSAAMTVTAVLNAGSISPPDVNDQYTYTFNANDHFRFNRTQSNLHAPFNNDIQLTVSSFIEPVDSVALPSSATISGSGGLIYYGRIRIENAYGPETEPVPQLFKAEYFNGTQFILNSLDSSSLYDVSDIHSITVSDVGDSANNLTVGDSINSGVPANTGLFNAGFVNTQWSIPAVGRYGAYQFFYDVESWLEYDWDSSADGVDEDPSGIVNFGQYRGSDRIIYWKEINY